MTGTPASDGSRSARQRQAIIVAAAAVFARHGFKGAATDEIAARAAVSKQTLYKHFPAKDQLFASVILGAADELDVLLGAVPSSPDLVLDVHAELRRLARRWIAALIRPEVIQLRRLIIAEADRFPELGQAFYERGPERVTANLIPWFQRLAERGLLRLGDPDLAARHFVWLVLSVPWNKALFCGSEDAYRAGELEYYADEGVRAFLTGYGPR